jgi:4-amino-4-deoxychorismate lyase
VEGALRDPPAGLRLIETLAWDGAAPVREGRHLARMGRAAAALGWPWDARAAARALRHGRGGADRTEPARLRLTYDGRTFACEAGPMPPPAALWRVAVHPARLRSRDPWLRVKSTNRALYDAARASLASGLDEWLFLNERGEACEGTITTLFFDRGGGWRTPPLACGCLPGVLRGEMIEAGCREEVLVADDLPRVRLAVGNSVRGLIPAVLA